MSEGAYGFNKDDVERVADVTKQFERVYKGGAQPPSSPGPRYGGLVQKFLTTGTINAGTANVGAMPTPGSGTANMWTGHSPATQAVGTGNALGLTIYNDGLASIASGTVVYCVFTCGAWWVIWVLCP